MPVVLLNRTRRSVVVILEHSAYCEARGVCSCVKIGDRAVPTSLTICALGAVHDVHDACRGLRQLRALVKRGELSCVEEQAPPEVEPSVDEHRAAGRRAKGKK